jgi:tetratricopeptide (TPR) repeat protein
VAPSLLYNKSYTHVEHGGTHMLETTAQAGLVPHSFNSQPSVENFQQHRKSQSISSKAYAFIANARVLTKNGEYDLALNLLRQASNLQSHEIIFKEMAMTLVLKKSWDEARMITLKWHALYPSFDSSYTKAQIEYELGLDDLSLQSYFESLSVVTTENKELFDILKNIGNIYVRKGDFESAEEFYNKAYAMNSHSDILYVNYGILEMQRGDLNKAKDRFRTALHINSDNDKAWTSLAMVHFEFGDEDLGVANIKRALDINPTNKTAISFAYQKMAQKKHADFLIETMQKFLDRAEFDEEVSCMMIQKLYETGRLQLAILECHRLLLWNPLKEEYFNLINELEGQMT